MGLHDIYMYGIENGISYLALMDFSKILLFSMLKL